ncbi:probable serine/threonine-protein kinase PBL15 [Zingiber officinale]|uniref:probable serine/threonine-protein kinase PBL15 n=1 Tax=Zingiber officinale TaxID=94328 RepID=UPI001C4DB560|nr:probable serine/threonine-protein kinase PBL15 [Zingiber officinale]XP_042401050.1 probable serine/threonine-protein kinase PBL15 [Zingiber officinale]
MGCFTILKQNKKKKNWRFASKKAQNLNESTASTLPEPDRDRPSLQSAPPSFRIRTRSAQSINQSLNARARVLSAPCSLLVADRNVLEFDDQAECKGRSRSVKDQHLSNPLPLPLPSPCTNSVLKNFSSFKSNQPMGSSNTSGPLPLPQSKKALRNFSYDEISTASQHFSLEFCIPESSSFTVYNATIGSEMTTSKKIEATVTRLQHFSQNLKEFASEVNIIASLQHPNLCNLIGYHAQEGSDERMMIYERLYHGSFDRLLHGRSDGPSIDWPTRIKVALCAARGLAFLHEEGPFQAMYHEFSTSNIQVDKDFSAKLSGYGCVGYYNPDTSISNSSIASGNLSVETLDKGLLTPKSNVWSFGVVLLELLTGRKNLDARYPKEERNIVKWSKPFLADDCRLSFIMDPRIKGRFPPKAVRAVADILLKCLQKDPSERPTMRAIAESLENVQEIKCPIRYPLQEPSAVSSKQMLKSRTINGIIIPAPPPKDSFSMSLHLRSCSTTASLEDNTTSSPRKPHSPVLHRSARVEGF